LLSAHQHVHLLGSPRDAMALAMQAAAPLSTNVSAGRSRQRARAALAMAVTLASMGFIAGGGSLYVHSRAFAGAGAKLSLVQRTTVSHPWIRHAMVDAENPDTGSDFVGFGKHRDLTIAQLCQKEPDYVRWLQDEALNNDDVTPKVRAILQYADTIGSASAKLQIASVEDLDMGGGLVGFGKHKDLTIAQLCQQEPDYVRWLQDEARIKDGDVFPKVADILHYADTMGLGCQDWESMHERPLGFGKYANMPYNKVYKEHPDYISWLRKQSDKHPTSRQLIGYADHLDGSRSPQERMRHIGRQTVPFGKYKDLTIEKLCEEHVDYVEWLRSQKPPSDFAREVIDYADLKMVA